MNEATLDEFVPSSKTYHGKTKIVYRRGDAGPGVVLMHEIPGITPKLLGLGKLIAGAGYRVALPSLFGVDGKPPDPGYMAAEFGSMCVSAEFNGWAAHASSPVVDWLRALCKDLAAETHGPIGAIGLCITGGFALSLTVGTDGAVRAPVLSEPSLPFAVPGFAPAAAVHLTPEEQREIAAAHEPPVLGLRFTNDVLCTRARFDTYERLLGKQRFVERIEITSPDPAWQIPWYAHSVLTAHNELDPPEHPTRIAFDRVMAFLDRNLRGAVPPAPGSTAASGGGPPATP